MEFIPAIDLRDGRCVRLLRGDFDRETRYDFDPVELAVRYRDAGARWLHVVDLDGANARRPQNLPLVARMRTRRARASSLAADSATHADLVRALSIAERAVVGSLAVTEPSTVGAWLDELGGERLTLALDVRLGADGTPTVATHGWTQASAVTLAAPSSATSRTASPRALHRHRSRRRVGGPNVALYAECVRRWPQVAFVASGGVRDARDLAALARGRRRRRRVGQGAARWHAHARGDEAILTRRMIPCLDVRDGVVVKGVHFRDHRVVGDILELARRYRDEGADELVFYDITASPDGRTVDRSWVNRVAEVLDIPFCVAGGIRSVADAESVLNVGADKISINSPALERPALIDELARRFGSQCVVVGIDSLERDGDYHVYQYTRRSEPNAGGASARRSTGSARSSVAAPARSCSTA